MNYAIIENGIVIAIVGVYPENDHKHLCVPCHDNVKVGDNFLDGRFYRNNEEIFSQAETQLLIDRDEMLQELIDEV